MTPLVVLSHPEPTSFAAALARTAAETLDATLLDLYAEGFDPRLSPGDFTDREDPARLRPMEEQLHAVRTGTLAPDVARHVELLRSTDLLVMVQPLWWFSLPAMAKGWIDRVFVNGLAYEYPGYEPWTGPLDHVRALAVFTSSYEREEFEPGGRAGSVEAVLHPLLWGRSPTVVCRCSSRSSPTRPTAWTTGRGRGISRRCGSGSSRFAGVSVQADPGCGRGVSTQGQAEA